MSGVWEEGGGEGMSRLIVGPQIGGDNVYEVECTVTVTARMKLQVAADTPEGAVEALECVGTQAALNWSTREFLDSADLDEVEVESEPVLVEPAAARQEGT